ncbi:hypothetical protein RR48_08831 [Papilio machaon]|uniref:Uncharacterized protein n=1 Tax=Papilio machaon TaxID=76193 RepID=A0A194QWP3_PAPMA|nr:uncharacterized protein LOC106716892 [Papilio machaon]KPJ09380.1 hypothetical protein RR48_08831 [Papilio machaon]
MQFLLLCVCLSVAVGTTLSTPIPADGFVFPDAVRNQRKLEPITPPVLPVLEHLERDPSTLLPGEGNRRMSETPKPRFGFGGGFNVAPTGNGGLSASVSSSASGAGLSHSASQSFSFGFNEGFSASHSASQASSFNGFGSFSGSQASSQAASFSGAGASLSGSAAAAAAQAGSFGSQSTSSAFGFNSINDGFPRPQASFGEGLLDIRHRGVPNFPFPNLLARNKGSGAAAFRTLNGPKSRNGDDFLAVLVSN